MNKFVRIFSLVLCFFFSSNASAEVRVSLGGAGTGVDAVKAFNKAVASSGGTVDGNSVTEFSSAGIFGEYQAKMYVETDGGKVSVRINVKRKTPDLLMFLTVQEKTELEVATKIYESMKKNGYHDLNAK